MCDDLDEEVLFPYDDWYDEDDRPDDWDAPGCGTCWDSRTVPARLLPSRRQRRCRSCTMGRFAFLWFRLRFRFAARFRRHTFTDEAPF